MATLRAIYKRDFNGVYPSDIDDDWHWGVIQREDFAYGVYLRFKTDEECKCYAMSFSEAGFEAVYDRHYNVLHYTKKDANNDNIKTEV